MTEVNEKQLSYEALKIILKHSSLKRREEIIWKIPALKTPNSIVPYKLVHVCLSNNYIKVNRRKWNIRMDDEEGDTACLTIVNAFLKNNTKIKELVLFSVPEAIKNQNPDAYRLNVNELRLDGPTVFQDVLPFIQHNMLKRITFEVKENTLQLLEQLLVKNSETISLLFWEEIPLDNLLLNLPNKNIQIIYDRLPIDEVEKLAVSWRDSKRPIQSTFSLAIEEYAYVIDVFDHLQERIGAIPSRIEKLGSVYISHCVTIKINDDSELVVSGGPMTFKTFRRRPFQWTLRMEVVPSGSTIAKLEKKKDL